MFNIIFCKDSAGKETVKDFIYELKDKSRTNKHCKIQFEKIMAYLGALQKFGTRIGYPVVRHIGGDLWELRPLENRIFFFQWDGNNFVILHHFIKKSQKTPKREIEKAQINLKIFIERNEKNGN